MHWNGCGKKWDARQLKFCILYKSNFFSLAAALVMSMMVMQSYCCFSNFIFILSNVQCSHHLMGNSNEGEKKAAHISIICKLIYVFIHWMWTCKQFDVISHCSACTKICYWIWNTIKYFCFCYFSNLIFFLNNILPHDWDK